MHDKHPQHLLALQAPQEVDEQRHVVSLKPRRAGREQLPDQVHDPHMCRAVCTLELCHEAGQHGQQRLGADQVHAGEQGRLVGRGEAVVGWEVGKEASERDVHHILVGFEHVGYESVADGVGGVRGGQHALQECLAEGVGEGGVGFVQLLHDLHDDLEKIMNCDRFSGVCTPARTRHTGTRSRSLVASLCGVCDVERRRHEQPRT